MIITITLEDGSKIETNDLNLFVNFKKKMFTDEEFTSVDIYGNKFEGKYSELNSVELA